MDLFAGHAMSVQLRFKPSFNLHRLIWSRPDSRIAPFCSICSQHIPDDAVPLKMWKADGSCVQLCDHCVELYLERSP